MENKLIYYLEILTNLNSNKYAYIQGYHDNILNFLLIFNDKSDLLSLTISQRFSEIFYNPFLKYQKIFEENEKNKKSKKNQDAQKDLNFINNIIMHLIKKIDMKIFHIIEDCCMSNPTFALTWVITYFGYIFDNIFFQFRILDYLICSHPIAVFYLSANLITLELNKFLYDYKENDEKFIEVDYKKFKDLKDIENNCNNNYDNNNFEKVRIIY